jgi:hypothetical protein
MTLNNLGHEHSLGPASDQGASLRDLSSRRSQDVSSWRKTDLVARGVQCALLTDWRTSELFGETALS